MSDIQADQAAKAEHKQNLETLQRNIEAQMKDLSDGVQGLYDVKPQPDGLTNLSMSVNQIETNIRSLLALAKLATGLTDELPQPAPLVSTEPSSAQPAPETVDAKI